MSKYNLMFWLFVIMMIATNILQWFSGQEIGLSFYFTNLCCFLGMMSMYIIIEVKKLLVSSIGVILDNLKDK